MLRERVRRIAKAIAHAAEIEKIIMFTQQFYGCHYSIVRLNSLSRLFFFYYCRLMFAARTDAPYHIRIKYTT